MPTVFHSPLAHRLQAFWEARHGGGQRGFSTHVILRELDGFLQGELQPGDALTQEVAQHWFKSMEHLSAGTRVNRISVLRQFCLYQHFFDRRTCLIPRTFLPRRTRFVPYIYSRREVAQIMSAAKRIGPARNLRPAVIATLVGLLFSTGLRIGEALKLTIADFDFNRRLLHIRYAKFKKSRYVPLSPSTAHHLAVYRRKLRRAGFATSAASPLFVALSGGQLAHNSFSNLFLAILRQLGIRGARGVRGPRVHDARHTFCVNRLLAWHRIRANLFAKLPALSTYLGHRSLSGTQTYLHATAELLESVGERFHAHFAVPSAKRKKHAHH